MLFSRKPLVFVRSLCLLSVTLLTAFAFVTTARAANPNNFQVRTAADLVALCGTDPSATIRRRSRSVTAMPSALTPIIPPAPPPTRMSVMSACRIRHRRAAKRSPISSSGSRRAPTRRRYLRLMRCSAISANTILARNEHLRTRSEICHVASHCFSSRRLPGLIGLHRHE
jgi:hypothetical protein